MPNYTPEESIRRVRDNANLEELADIFEYCYNHLDKWENGDIYPTELPHVGEDEVFNEFTGALVLRSIAFGCSWEEHVPSNRDQVSFGETE